MVFLKNVENQYRMPVWVCYIFLIFMFIIIGLLLYFISEDSIEQINADHTIDESINDLSISQWTEDDTYISELDNNTLTHPNMVRLIPHPQSPSVSRLNARSSVVTSNSHHPNRVPLSYSSQLSFASRHGLLSTSSTTVTTPLVNNFQLTSPVSTLHHLNLRQPVVTSNSQHHPNTVQLSYSPRLLSDFRSRNNRLQHSSSISATNPIPFNTNTNIGPLSRH